MEVDWPHTEETDITITRQSLTWNTSREIRINTGPELLEEEKFGKSSQLKAYTLMEA